MMNESETLAQQNFEAFESLRLLTNEEFAALMERRARERTEHWTRVERGVRLGIMKLRGMV